jgi:transcriptional regulator with XRE-family HTH domain
MLSERVSWARKVSGLSSVRAFAIACGIQPGQVLLIESGERPTPSSETCLRIADAIGCTLDWLIAGRGDPPSEETVRESIARAHAARSEAA